MIIAIDGPAGTGKSTVAKEVAKRLGFAHFDTGAMYRSLAWWACREGIDPQDEAALVAALPRFHYEIRIEGSEKKYFVGEHDITREIRTPEISMAASQVAVFADVRHEMVKIQRKYGNSGDVVFEGRDMGTVVFPHAEVKIFLTASPEVRAERRFLELKAKTPNITQEKLLKEIKERDLADETRAHSPLKQADDAILVDTSNLTADQVVKKVLQLVEERKIAPMSWRYYFVYWCAKIYFKLFFRLKVYGTENFTRGSAIIAANHVSFFDPPILSASCPEEVHFLAKSSLFDIPIFGRFIAALNAHPVDRSASDTQTFRRLIELLSVGNKVIIFPEGERSMTGEMLPLERGLAFLASKANCRIIPAYIAGAFEAWPRERKWPKFFGKITVVFGKPILPIQDRDEMTRKVEESLRVLKEVAAKRT